MDLAGNVITANRGFFSRAQALDSGETDRTLRRALRQGQIVRLRQGMYAPAEDLAQLDESARHLLLARSVLASQRGRVALTGPSAALLHGLDVWGHDLSVVHLLRLDQSTGRRSPDVVHHVASPQPARDVVEHEGLLTVDPIRAAWEVARLSSLESAVVTLDSFLRRHPDLADPVWDLAQSFQAHPKSRVARLAVRLARGGAESPGESLTRVACYRFGVPAPILQYEVVDASGSVLGRSDFYWEQYRHLAEFDGKIKYERLLKPGQSASDCVVAEKRREDAFRATMRGMSRIIWAEVMPRTARRTMATLMTDLQRSRTLYVR